MHSNTVCKWLSSTLEGFVACRIKMHTKFKVGVNAIKTQSRHGLYY